MVCVENTHNMCGGSVLDKQYIDALGGLAKDLEIAVHVDGARIFNACVALGISPAMLCESADTVSICLSKGLGAPMGSVLVGSKETIRLARRARKRLGGGTRQVGVVAAQGLYAVEHNIDRLAEDHYRSKKIAKALYDNGFYQPQEGKVQTNIVYFGLPLNCTLTTKEFAEKLKTDFNILIGSGYSKGGSLFRVSTHLDVNDVDVDFAINGILKLASLYKR
jgi:threonine aldolase